jgi:hypothetical protein
MNECKPCKLNKSTGILERVPGFHEFSFRTSLDGVLGKGEIMLLQDLSTNSIVEKQNKHS